MIWAQKRDDIEGSQSGGWPTGHSGDALGNGSEAGATKGGGDGG